MGASAALCDVGFIGLGVMGKNLVLNLADNGYKVACFDLDQKRVEGAIAQDQLETHQGEPRVFPCDSYTELLAKVKVPHLIILSVPAGEPVDHVCARLVDPGIQADDIIVDTGNSLWTDSVAREQQYKGQFIFFSTAVSGGEVGARFGPSLMPSGDPYAWTRIEPVWKAIAAKVDSATGKPIENNTPGKVVSEGEPCTTYIGPIGAGHYVKMVHNGIEYADMQLICEAYHILSQGLGMQADEVAQVFQQWNRGPLNSYLMEISAEVLEHQDSVTGKPLVEMILDKAGQKGTGLWTAVSALQVGSPAQTITQAVFARSISSLKNERVRASQILEGPSPRPLSDEEKQLAIAQLHDSLYCSKICAYAQGFQLMDMAAKEYNWQLDFAEIAKIWRAGCIIRAEFLQSITLAYEQDEKLENLLLAPYFSSVIAKLQQNWRQAIAQATVSGIPCGAMASALSYYDSYRNAVLPANLLQAQRDYFGAHTYERTDQPAGKKYHTDWSHKDKPEIKI